MNVYLISLFESGSDISFLRLVWLVWTAKGKVQRGSAMAMIALQVILAFLATASAKQIAVNIHNCELEGQTHLTCPWRGPGVYRPDRALVGVHQVSFEKLLKPSVVDMTGQFAMEVKVVDIADGDIGCDNIRTSPSVYIFIRQQRACVVWSLACLCIFFLNFVTHNTILSSSLHEKPVVPRLSSD